MSIEQKRLSTKQNFLTTGKDMYDLLNSYGESFLDVKDLNIKREMNDVFVGKRKLTNTVLIPVFPVNARNAHGVKIADTLDEYMVDAERTILLALKDHYAPQLLDYSPDVACVGKELFGFTSFERPKTRVAPVLVAVSSTKMAEPPIPTEQKPKKRIAPTAITTVPPNVMQIGTEGRKKEIEMLKHSKILGPLLAKEGMIGSPKKRRTPK